MEILRKLNARFLPGRIFSGPEWIVLGVNNICNLHCKMCDVGAGFTESNFAINLVGTHPMNMPLELITRIIDDLADHFPDAKLGYAFTEPLIYPHLLASLRYAKERKLYTAVTTNALTLGSLADELCKTGLDELFVSLDGPEEIHNYIRGHKSSFQRACAGMDMVFANTQRPEVSVFCTITEWNIGHLQAFANHFANKPLKQLGFMHTNFTPVEVVEAHNQQYGNLYPASISNTTETKINTTNIELLWQEIQHIRAANYPFRVLFSPELTGIPALEVFYQKPGQLIGKTCGDIFKNIMIKSDGTVIPAHGRCYNITIGNIYQNNIAEIWNSESIARFRKDVMKAGGLLPACSRCCSAFAK